MAKASELVACFGERLWQEARQEASDVTGWMLSKKHVWFLKVAYLTKEEM